MIYLMSSKTSSAFLCLTPQLFEKLVHTSLQNLHDNFQKEDVVTVNKMDHDVVEVNGFDPQMLPGSFLDPGYEANCSCTLPLLLLQLFYFKFSWGQLAVRFSASWPSPRALVLKTYLTWMNFRLSTSSSCTVN